LVHANAAGANEIELLRARGCAVIWCPSSNLATYGQTLAPGAFRGIGIALGTDSAITAGTDLLDEIRVAHDHGAAPEELYRMVTCSAAAILRLRPNPADYIAVSDTGQTPDEAIFNLNPEMVIRNGEIKLISTRLSGALPHLLTNLHPISIESRGSWLIAVDVPELMRQTVEHLGTGFRLAGKLVS
jgi:cytosine/adenosine deaminase-related metal-dependent hydrolase